MIYKIPVVWTVADGDSTVATGFIVIDAPSLLDAFGIARITLSVATSCSVHRKAADDLGACQKLVDGKWIDA